MTLLLNYRVWIALALAGLLAFTHIYAYRSGKHHVQLEWTAATAQANEDARKLEQQRQRRVDDAARIAAERSSRILADAASARRESDGLRDDLSAAKQYAKQSRDAAERVARLSSDLLGRCESKYLGVAESAARADSYARQLMQGWPK